MARIGEFPEHADNPFEDEKYYIRYKDDPAATLKCIFDVTISQSMILYHIITNCKGNTTYYINIDEIADTLGFSEKTIHRSLQTFLEMGLIAKSDKQSIWFLNRSISSDFYENKFLELRL